MKTRYKFIHFVEITDKFGALVWSCRNNYSNGRLGEIRWYSAWRQYVFEPTCFAIYSVGCLKDINLFIEQL